MMRLWGVMRHPTLPMMMTAVQDGLGAALRFCAVQSLNRQIKWLPLSIAQCYTPLY